MEEPVYEEKYKGYTIKLYPDEDPFNPRGDGANLGVMVCFHKRYTLGDDHKINKNFFKDWAEMEQAIVNDLGAIVVLPVYLYDHGGITISTNPFGDNFDSGQVGFIYATRDSILKFYGVKELSFELTNKDAIIELRGEVSTYDDYLTGRAYGWRITKGDDDEELDSCWGYLGEWYGDGSSVKDARMAIDAWIKTELEAEQRRVTAAREVIDAPLVVRRSGI